MTTSDPARVRGTEGRSDAHGSEVTAAPEHGQRDEDEGRRLFSRRARHAGLVWVAATIPIAAVLGVFVHGQHDYLLAWVLIGALNLVPAFGLAIIAYRRAADADKNFWKLISIGV